MERKRKLSDLDSNKSYPNIDLSSILYPYRLLSPKKFKEMCSQILDGIQLPRSVNQSDNKFDLLFKDTDTDSNPSLSQCFGNDSQSVNKDNAKRRCKRTKEEINLAMEERKRLQEERSNERLRKAAVRDNIARMKPGNCMKHITVHIDIMLTGKPYLGDILRSINLSGSSHSINTHRVPFTITWTRAELIDGIEVDKEEDFVLLLWDTTNVFDSLEDEDSLKENMEKIESVVEKLPGKRITLALFGLDHYLATLKKAEKRNFRLRVANDLNLESDSNKLGKVVEEFLTELQILYDISTFPVNTSVEVGNLLARFTKSIAETPYKLEMQKLQVEELGWCAVSDLKESIRVDKFGNGLSRLWLQQLQQFNTCNLDVAQAIAQQYPTPKTLYQAFINCESKEKGEELLKDIILRRGLGESAATRRVGPELSKKLFYFFTNLDGNFMLSQE